MGVSYTAFESADKIHVHIKDTFAYFAFYMTVIALDMVKTICTPGYLKAAYFAHLGKQLQISVYCCTADVRMLPGDFVIYFVCRSMAAQFVYCFQH